MHKDKALQIISENCESYNSIAADFDVARQTAWPEFEFLKPYIKEGSRILDIGCGNGRLLSFLNCRGCEALQYVGVDQSEELIKIARNNNPPLTPPSTDGGEREVDFRVADVFNLPFKDGEFDVVAGIAFLHHIPSRELREKCLKEIYRVLAPGGILFLTNWNLCQCKLIKKYKLQIWDFFFPHQGMDAGDFWIPFRYNCHSERSEESRDPSGKGPQDDKVMRFYHHFSKREIIKLCRNAGFKNIKYKIGKTERNSVVIAQK